MNKIENQIFARTTHMARSLLSITILFNNFRRKALAHRIDNIISPRISVILNAIELDYLVSLNKI